MLVDKLFGGFIIGKITADSINWQILACNIVVPEANHLDDLISILLTFISVVVRIKLVDQELIVVFLRCCCDGPQFSEGNLPLINEFLLPAEEGCFDLNVV